MKITKASDIMTKDVITASRDMSITEVMKTILSEGTSGLPVVDSEGMLEGMISEIDLVNSMLSGNAADTSVAEIMSTNVKSFPPDATCAEIATCFITTKLRRVPIASQGRVIGIVSRRDVLRELLDSYESIKSE